MIYSGLMSHRRTKGVFAMFVAVGCVEEDREMGDDGVRGRVLIFQQ